MNEEDKDTYSFNVLAVNQIVEDAVKGMQESGKIAAIIKSKIESTIENKLNNVFSWHGDFGGELEKHLSKTLRVNFKGLLMDEYNDQILRMMQAILDQKMQSDAQVRVKEAMERILADPPERVLVSELVKNFLVQHSEVAQEKGWEHMTFIVHDRNDKFFTYIYLDKEPYKSKYQCKYQIGINKSGGKSEVFTLKINGQDLQNGVFVGPFYEVERVLYQAFVAKIPIELDDQDIDLSYPEYNEDECEDDDD